MADLNIPNLNIKPDKYIFKKKLNLRRKSKRRLLSESFFLFILSVLLDYIIYLIPNKNFLIQNLPLSLNKSFVLILDLFSNLYEIFLTIYIFISSFVALILMIGSFYRLFRVSKRKSKQFIYMGEYVDVGIQTSILPLSIILSSIVLGIFALFGEETENDDDDSDSGSGGLMQPIWNYLYTICFDFLLKTLNNLFKEPTNNISAIKDDTKIKITRNISYKYEKSSINNKKDLLNVEGRFCNSKFLLGIK